jgi:hypothetical protein
MFTPRQGRGLYNAEVSLKVMVVQGQSSRPHMKKCIEIPKFECNIAKILKDKSLGEVQGQALFSIIQQTKLLIM